MKTFPFFGRPLGALLLTALLWAGAPVQAQVQGAGASFPAQVYARWGDSFGKLKGGSPVSYRASNSADGIEKITSRAVQFGGTDLPLSGEELGKRRLVQVPMMVGGIVPVVHLPGVADKRLQLSGELLAELMGGQIARWNDARIAALNPGLALPGLPVKRVVRADRSGSSDALTRYLSLVSPAFKAAVGSGAAPKWPGEVLRAEGSEGMVRELRGTPGAIGYVGHDRAVQDRLVTARLRNAAGRFVAASESGFRAAIRESELHERGDDLAQLLNRPGLESWPITLTSFVLVDAEPPTAEAAVPVLRFLYWCFTEGDRLTEGTGFAPLPMHLQARLAARFANVRAKDGRPLNYVNF